MVLEDLQWADRKTLRALAELAGELAMLCTVQFGPVAADAVQALIESLDGEVIELVPLDPSVMAASIRAAKPDLLDGEVHRLVDAAAGNPLVANVLVASADGAPIERAPHSKALAASLGRLSADARATLFVLGAVRGPWPVDQLREVDALERAGFVRRTGDGRCALVSEVFAHPALLSLGMDERTTVLEQLSGADDISAQQRAEYLLLAGHPARAMHEALAAASGPLSRSDQASALLVAAESARQLHVAGELPVDRRDPLLVSAARALNDSSRFAEAGDLLGQFDRIDDAQEVAALVERLRSTLGAGDARAARQLLSERRQLFDAAEGVDGERARALRNMLLPSLVPGARMSGPFGVGPDVCTSATGRAEAAMIAGVSNYSVDIDSSMAWFRAAREEAVSTGALASELEATRNLVMVQIALGHHEDARAGAQAAASTAAQAGEASWAIEFRTLEVLSRFYDDADHDEALSWLSYVRTAPARFETRALATACLATLLADRGALRRSGEVLEPWVEHARLEVMEPLSQAFLAWGAAQRSWIIGDLAHTIRIARWATDTVPPGYPSLAGTQVVWRWAEYESGLPLSAPDPAGGLLDCATIEAGAISMLARGSFSEAAEAFHAAAESWRPILWRNALRCRWAAGHSLSLAGDRGAAVGILEAVDAELDRSGIPALRQRVRTSLRASAPAPASVPRLRGTSVLTGQEHKVLLLIVEGHASSEIARRLGVATSTVNSHVGSAKRKLGARTRIEAAAIVGLHTG